MATFSGQPFQFQNVREEDVFPEAGFWTALVKFENFLQIFIQLIADKVISKNTIND